MISMLAAMIAVSGRTAKTSVSDMGARALV
jgi:hypothetical protein